MKRELVLFIALLAPGALAMFIKDEGKKVDFI